MGNEVLIKTSFFTDFYSTDLLCCQMIDGHRKKPETMDSNHKKSKHSIAWRDPPEAQDYPAASSDLCLLLHHSSAVVEKLLNQLQAETITQSKAKDIFRAALFDEHNFHMARDLGQRQLIIADGDHHLCAVYLQDEEALIPCQMISLTIQDLASL